MSAYEPGSLYTPRIPEISPPRDLIRASSSSPYDASGRPSEVRDVSKSIKESK